MNECVCLCSNNSLFTKTVEQKSVVVAVQSLKSCLTLCEPMDCSMQTSLCFLISRSLLKLMSLESVMPSNHLILCHPFSSCLQSFPASGSFPMSRLCIRWPKYWSFSINPSSEYSGLISFRIDWFDLLAVQGTLKKICGG